MNWFETKSIASLAKSAFKEAQRTLDNALDIHDDDGKYSSACFVLLK